jgi:hypothetical protein
MFGRSYSLRSLRITSRLMRAVRISLGACACLAQVVCLAPGAYAAGGHGAQAPRTGYFQTLDGAIGFVFDRSGERPRQRFDGSPEIMLLQPVPAARGDIVFRQSDGLVVLRETPFGALTLFSRHFRSGLPVVRVSDASPLMPAPRNADEVTAAAGALAARLKAGLGTTIGVELPALADISQPDLGIFGEAIENSVIAFDQFLASPTRAVEVAAVVRIVRYPIAAKPGATLSRTVLRVDVAPRLGLGGRPSSLELAAVIERALAAHAVPAPATAFDRAN